MVLLKFLANISISTSTNKAIKLYLEQNILDEDWDCIVSYFWR